VTEDGIVTEERAFQAEKDLSLMNMTEICALLSLYNTEFTDSVRASRTWLAAYVLILVIVFITMNCICLKSVHPLIFNVILPLRDRRSKPIFLN